MDNNIENENLSIDEKNEIDELNIDNNIESNISSFNENDTSMINNHDFNTVSLNNNDSEVVLNTYDNDNENIATISDNTTNLNSNISENNNSKKNKNLIMIVLSILVIIIIIITVFFCLNNKKSTQKNPTAKNNTTTKYLVSDISLLQASVNNSIIPFPSEKRFFDDINWKWDEKYAKVDLASGYSTSGGRIGSYPGGAVVSVVNNSGETKHIEDCVIDDATFYNPKDGSVKINFFGNLSFDSTKDDVETTMKKHGYKNPKIDEDGSAIYYNYYLNDDSSNFKDYLQFYFFDGVIESVSIYTSGN